MLELSGNLWDYHARGDFVAITTGGAVGRNGAAQMPRGCAAQAKKLFPGIEMVLGRMICLYGNHVHDLGNRILSFPVENSPYEIPEMRIIERSSRELVEKIDRYGCDRVIVPRPGCGGGGLAWPEVRGVLAGIFDHRFHLISQQEQA